MLCFKFMYSFTVIHHVAQINEVLHDALMAFQRQDVEADLILHTHQPSNFHVIKNFAYDLNKSLKSQKYNFMYLLNLLN